MSFILNANGSLAVSLQLAIELVDRTKELAHFDLTIGNVLLNETLDHEVWLFNPFNARFRHQAHRFTINIFKNPTEREIRDLITELATYICSILKDSEYGKLYVLTVTFTTILRGELINT